MSIGVSGSGKSTYLKKYVIENNFTYICPDEIREELTGDAADQSENKKVWEIAYEKLEYAINKKENIIFDSTMVNKKSREEFVKFVKNKTEQNEYVLKALVFKVPLDLCIDRNSKRERKVPEEVIKRQYEMLTNYKPEIKEGFHFLEIIQNT